MVLIYTRIWRGGGEQSDEWISLTNPPANTIMTDVLDERADRRPSAAGDTNLDSKGRGAPPDSTLSVSDRVG